MKMADAAMSVAVARGTAYRLTFNGQRDEKKTQ
jgi:hypothetical protein